MGYERHYGSMSREDADAAAINDLKDYLGEEKFKVTVQYAENVTDHTHIRALNFAISMAGISGRPFHAFCRRYCFEAYREWMHHGGDAVMTDEQGFPL